MADLPTNEAALAELTDLRHRVAELEALAAAAEHARVALAHERAGLARKCRQQERLLNAARRVASTLDPTEVLTRICAEARGILASFGCVVYVLDQDRRLLFPVAAIEPPVEQQVLATPLSLDRSLTGQAVLAGRAMIFNQAYGHPLGQEIPGTAEMPDERVIAAPFSTTGHTMGAICLSRTGEDYTREDLAVVDLLAEQASMALGNARLHSTLEAEVEERKRAEQALRASEERHRTLFQRVPVALYRTSPDGRLIDANPALLDLLGLPDRASALGCRATDFFVSQDEREAEQSALAARGTISGYTLRIRRSDGAVISVEDTARAVYDEEGVLLYYEGSLRDVTREHEARAERERLISDLQDALAHARTLSGLLPICAWCGKVRDDEGYWQRLERYIAEHSHAEFTHGICPECAARLSPDAAPSPDGED